MSTTHVWWPKSVGMLIAEATLTGVLTAVSAWAGGGEADDGLPWQDPVARPVASQRDPPTDQRHPAVRRPGRPTDHGLDHRYRPAGQHHPRRRSRPDPRPALRLVVGSLLIYPPAPLSKGRRQPQPARACEGRPETFRYAHRAPY